MNLFFRIWPLVRYLFFTGLIFLSVGCLSCMFLVFYIARDLPKLPSPLSRIIETPQSQIYASNGKVLLTLGERKTVPLEMVSQDFIDAIIATEDHRFQEHRGINKLRTLKGLYITFAKPGKIQGASTITQQLAKNLFFSFEQTFTRKFRELLVAFQIEASCSKSEILHAYINQIHFGAGAQGVEKAAQVYFGKSASDLTLSEAALLAGLPKSPTYYNPFRHYDRALKRRDTVLDRMVQVGVITREKAQLARENKPELNTQQADSRTGNYFLDALIRQLVENYGEEVVFHGGIKVYSTIDPQLQKYARSALQNGLANLDRMMQLPADAQERPQGALVAIDVGTGAVLALVGGRDYSASEFNRATRSRRQPGSGFKPFLYYTAFQQLGYHPATVVKDQPVIIELDERNTWSPRNFSKEYGGNMVLKQALMNSVNTVAAQLIVKTGPGPVNLVAENCGIESPLANVYSTALGTSEVTPFEMAGAYSVFAGLGLKKEAYLYRRVEDAFGHVIFEHFIQGKRVLEAGAAYQVVDMMKSVIETGSGRSVRKAGFHRIAAGKTGTTDQYNDAWFTGFTPGLSVSVWTGFDRKRKLVTPDGAGITGGAAAAPIWAEFMKNALKSQPEKDFPVPDNIRFETVLTQTGCNPSPDDTESRRLPVALKTDQQLCQDSR